MGNLTSKERVALLERIARLATELCVSVDKAAEDIGGERPALEILRDIGPLTDQLEKLGPEPAAGVGVTDLAGSSSHETPAPTRPQPSPNISHNEYLRQVACWAGIEWRRDSMHVTAENAIQRAADYKDQIERRAGNAFELAWNQPGECVYPICRSDHPALAAGDALAHQSVFTPFHERWWQARGGHEKCTVCNQSPEKTSGDGC